MKGWVLVGKGSWERGGEFTAWLAIGRAFALSLSKKASRSKTFEEIYDRDRR